jgi:uncharacterized membrane protein YfcA
MVDNPWFYVAAVPAILITAISKGGFAGGLGILAVPLMSLVLPPSQVAGIMLPILCVMDAVGLWAYRRAWDAASLRILMPAAILGNIAGTVSFRWLDDQAIKFIVGVIAVAFTVSYWLAKGARKPPARPDWRKGTFWGAVSGFTSFVSHVGGQPLNVYLLPLKLEKTVYVGTTVVYFAWVNFTKLPAYYYLGQLSPPNLATSLVLSPLAPLGMLLGIWLHGRINTVLFYRIIYALVFVSGSKLVFDGIAGMLRHVLG